MTVVVTAAINTGVVTLVITLVNAGLPLPVLPWLKTWALAFSIITPLALFLPEQVKKLLSRFIKD